MKNTNIFKDFKGALKTDVLSGFLVSLIALPLCLGIAGASGFPPVMGVLTAIIGGMLVSFFMGSETTIKGPAAGLIVIIYGAVDEFSKASGDSTLGWKLTAATILVAGILQVLLGVFKTAKIVEFFPLSAVHGMLAAIGIIIISKQLHLTVGIAPSELKGKDPMELLAMVPHSLTHVTWQIAIIGIVSLAILFGWTFLKGKIFKTIPAALVVLLVGIVIGRFEHLNDRTFTNLHPLVEPGEMKFAMNADFNIFNAAYIGITLKYILLLVLIGSLESLLSTKAIDLLDPQKRKSNMNRDLSSVGAGNALSGLLGGLPMISEIARSSANLNNGGRTRWSNFFHGVFLLLFVLVLSDFIKLIPVASLASMLVFVGVRLAAPAEFRKTYKIGWEQLVVFVSTIIATLTTDLLVGILVGILVKIILQLILGVPLSHYLKAKTEIVKNADGKTIIFMKSSGLFTNFIGIEHIVQSLPLGNDITLNVENVKFLDHSFMEKFHEFRKSYHEKGGHLHIDGMEKLKTLSSHPLSARKSH